MNNGFKTKVLVIDDDQALCDTLRMMLEPYSFELYQAITAKTGIEQIDHIKPDLIIMDLHMSDVDGWEATEMIRSFSQIPILVLSAISKPELVIKALDKGADDYLIKPVPISVLVAHLNRLTRRAKTSIEYQNSSVK